MRIATPEGDPMQNKEYSTTGKRAFTVDEAAALYSISSRLLKKAGFAAAVCAVSGFSGASEGAG